jgi:hypothetical protein
MVAQESLEKALETQEDPEVPEVVVSDEDLKAAATALGNYAITAKKMRGFADVGQFVNQTGPMQIGLGVLILANESLINAINCCDRAAARAKAPETILEVVDRQNKLIGQQIELAMAFTKIKGSQASKKGGSEKITQLSFPPSSPVVATSGPVQVNIHSSEKPQP